MINFDVVLNVDKFKCVSINYRTVDNFEYITIRYLSNVYTISIHYIDNIVEGSVVKSVNYSSNENYNIYFSNGTINLEDYSIYTNNYSIKLHRKDVLYNKNLARKYIVDKLLKYNNIQFQYLSSDDKKLLGLIFSHYMFDNLINYKLNKIKCLTHKKYKYNIHTLRDNPFNTHIDCIENSIFAWYYINDYIQLNVEYFKNNVKLTIRQLISQFPDYKFIYVSETLTYQELYDYDIVKLITKLYDKIHVMRIDKLAKYYED